MLASPALRTPRTCPSSTRRDPPSLSFTIATSTPPARECARAQAHVYTHTLYVPALFSFPFLFLSLGHASTPFPHPRSSFEFCGKRVSLSSFLPPFLPPVSLRRFFSLLFSFTRQSPDLSPSYPIPRGCRRCYFFLYRIHHFPLGLKECLLLAPSAPHSPRNSRPLRRQPNKCLSDYLHRHFSATLS